MLGYARTAERADLGTADPDVFPGFGDHVAALTAHDVEHGSRRAADFRADDGVRDLVDDWFDLREGEWGSPAP